MSATNTTTHYNLPSFLATDKPAWLVDWNGAMASIDAGIYQAQQTADTNTSDISGVQGSVTTLAGTVESQGLTISTLSQSLTTAIGNINTINSLIGNGTPTTTDQTIIGAINEINARTGEAEGISYDNTDSGLTATNVQSAIDENAGAISDLSSDLTWKDTNVTNNVGSSVTIPAGITPKELLVVTAHGTQISFESETRFANSTNYILKGMSSYGTGASNWYRLATSYNVSTRVLEVYGSTNDGTMTGTYKVYYR